MEKMTIRYFLFLIIWYLWRYTMMLSKLNRSRMLRTWFGSKCHRTRKASRWNGNVKLWMVRFFENHCTACSSSEHQHKILCEVAHGSAIWEILERRRDFSIDSLSVGLDVAFLISLIVRRFFQTPALNMLFTRPSKYWFHVSVNRQSSLFSTRSDFWP